MNIDPYEFDAQARNKSAKRDRTVKNKEVAKTQLPHSRLKSSFTHYKTITASRIECLTQANFKHPVISLYINLSPDRLLRQKDVFLTVFNSLKHTAIQDNKDYIESLSHEDRQGIEDDLWLLQDYLQNRFNPKGSKSIAIFKSKDELQWAFKLPMPSGDYLSIDPEPYTLPLLVSNDEQRQALVVHVEVDQVHFYRYRSGDLRQLSSFKSQVPDLSIDMSRPNKVQRHNYEHFNRHLQQACDALGQLSRKHRLNDVVLMGDDRVLNIFKKDCLSVDYRKKVIATLPYMPGSTEGQMAEQIYQELQLHEVAEEGYYLDMIQKNGGREGVVTGLDEVVSAQNRHMIRSLLVDQELKTAGYYCHDDHFISTESGDCPLCSKKMTPIDNIVDKLVELASQYKIDYKIIRQRTEDMQRYGGIVATMYDIQ